MTAAATIRRSSAAPKRRALAKRKGKAKPSLLVRAIEAIPVSAATIQRGVTWALLATMIGALIVIASMLGIPAWAGTQMGEAVGKAGFAVKRIEVTGIDRMDRQTVYALALDQQSRAMPMVDLAHVRDALLRYGWIADARVSRRLPDTLVVDIVERRPAAVWQHDGALSLIDETGVVLEPVALDAMPDLPLVIGPDANVQATALTELMQAAPRLKPLLGGATWVGNRRWDLRLQSGEVLALPEGEAAAGAAIKKFDEMDRAQRLLGRGFVRFDMRDPTRMFVRVGSRKPAIDQTSDEGAEVAPRATTKGDVA